MDEKEEVLPMTGGSGEISYAANSGIPEKTILESKLLVEEAVKDVYTKTQTETFVVADLGCSSGPNTFLLLSMIIHALAAHCHKLGQKPPDIQCFLNDLPGNDFNTLFKNMKFLEMKIEKMKNAIASLPNYYVMAVPGTFYGRLFPLNSVHFFHSSIALHWGSKVPDGVRLEEGVPLNKHNIHIAATSTPNIIKSYYEQFKSDFSTFLNLRFNELVPGGRMVLSFLERKSLDARNGELSCLLGLLADALKSMVHQGLVQEGKVESFHIPDFAPSLDEVKEVIIKQGSFLVDQLYTMVLNWDPNDDSADDQKPFDNMESGKNVANLIRSVYGPMLERHFGHAIMDELFARYTICVADHLLKEKTKFIIVVISLVK